MDSLARPFRRRRRRRLPARLAVVRRAGEPRDGAVGPAQLRLGQPGGDQRAALGQQGRGGRHAGLRRPQGLRAGAADARLRPAPRPRRGHGGAGRPGGVPRPPVAGVLPLPGRQGRGHLGRRAAGVRPLAGAGDARPPGSSSPSFFRYSSLASLVATAFAPFFRLLFHGGGPIVAAMFAMALLLVWRHRANIAKLLAGTESRIGAEAGAGHRRRTGRSGRRAAGAAGPRRRAPAGGRPVREPAPRAAAVPGVSAPPACRDGRRRAGAVRRRGAEVCRGPARQARACAAAQGGGRPH